MSSVAGAMVGGNKRQPPKAFFVLLGVALIVWCEGLLDDLLTLFSYKHAELGFALATAHVVENLGFVCAVDGVD